MTATMVRRRAAEAAVPPGRAAADRMVDLDTRTIVEPGVVVVQGEHILDVSPERIPDDAEVIELGDMTLLPGLMDMELNFLMGGAGGTLLSVGAGRPRDEAHAGDPGVPQTLLAGFTTVRNLGLFVQTGGLLLDVTLMRAIDAGWIPGPRIFPSGPRHHAERRSPRPHDVPGPRARSPPLTVEEGIADGVSRGSPRGALPDQVRREADQGVRVGRRDVAHRHRGCAALLRRGAAGDRRRGPSARHAGGRARARRPGHPAAVEAGIDCIEHASLMSEETQELVLRARAPSSCRRRTCPRPWTCRRRRPSCRRRRPRSSRSPRRRSRASSTPERRSPPAPMLPRSRTGRTRRSCGRWCNEACDRSTPSSRRR